jgi:glycine cleavage system H lipoate-binding protein
VRGEVVEINAAIEERDAVTDPYGKGWLFRI